MTKNSRIRQITPGYVQLRRRDNYVHHFECHKFIMAHPEEELKHYRHLLQYIQPPILNPFGCDSYDEEQEKEIIAIARSEAIQDASFLISWYLSDEGWQDFQRQWDELPEPTPDLCRELTNIHRRIADELIHGRN